MYCCLSDTILIYTAQLFVLYHYHHYSKTAAEKSTAVRKTQICLNDRPPTARGFTRWFFYITTAEIKKAGTDVPALVYETNLYI